MKRKGKGDILEIYVHDEYYVYAQVLQKDCIAYFDAKYSQPILNSADINRSKVLFVLSSSIDAAISTERWRIRGKLPINPNLKKIPLQFIQDAINPNIFSLYNCETGDITRTNRESCESLERCAIWYANQIEDRIHSHYNHTKCKWLITIDEWLMLHKKSVTIQLKSKTLM